MKRKHTTKKSANRSFKKESTKLKEMQKSMSLIEMLKRGRGPKFTKSKPRRRKREAKLLKQT